MKASLISLLAVAGFTAAQSGSSTVALPQCAMSCFQYAVAQAGCQANDPSCQCGKGAAKISQLMEPCLCKSGCPSSDFEQASEWSNLACKSAGGSPFSANANSCSSATSNSGSGGSVLVGGAPPITVVPSSTFSSQALLTATPSAAHSSQKADGTPAFFDGSSTLAVITPASTLAQQDGSLAVATGSPTDSATHTKVHHPHTTSSGSSYYNNGTQLSNNDAQTTTAPGSAGRVGGEITLVGLVLGALMMF